MPITFKVDNVKPVKQLFKPKLYTEVFKADSNWEASGCSALNLVRSAGHKDSFNSNFWRTVAIAHNRHHSLILTPDSVWITILQGLSAHVNLNPSRYRSRLGIKFDEKKDILVVNNKTVKGAGEKTDWLKNIKDFGDAIRSEVGESRYKLFLNPFSTTTFNEEAAMAITMMATYKSYFNYRMLTACGIPSITLEGSQHDWVDLRNRAQYLAEFDLEWWINPLLDVLNHFVSAFNGIIDVEFWKRIYSKFDFSGDGPYASGWLLTFFPYVHSHDENHPISMNPYLELWKNDKSLQGLRTDSFPESVLKVPFRWNYLGLTYDMEFCSGIVGTSQTSEGILRPEVGWGVQSPIPK